MHFYFASSCHLRAWPGAIVQSVRRCMIIGVLYIQGGSKVGSSAFKDLWIHGVTLFINLLTMAVGLFQVRWF